MEITKRYLSQVVIARQNNIGHSSYQCSIRTSFFSQRDLTVNAKRSSLAPSTVDKVVFIHAHFVNGSFELQNFE